MLGKYLNNLTDNRVPLTAGRYTVDMSGVVYDRSEGKILSHEIVSNGESFVTLDLSTGLLRLKVAVLVSIVYKRTRVPFEHWEKLDVLYVDGDVTNVSPGNTVWKFPISGIMYKNSKDFYYIPGFSSYVISKTGILFSTLTNREISQYSDKDGYLMVGVNPDVGSRRAISIHRLLALTFLGYPASVDLLDVNHIDGIKSNFSLSNLEWATRKRNCDHAYSTGLRSDNIQIVVRNYFTEEINTYYSEEECGRKLGLNGWTIGLRAQTDGKKLYYPGLQFKKITSTTPWISFKDPILSMLLSGSPVTVILIHRVTGSKLEFPSIKAASVFLGSTRKTVRDRLIGK